MSTIYNGFNKYNIVPYSADRIGVFNADNELVGYVNVSDKKPEYGTRLYRFGLLSDVHQQTSQSSENNADFQNALKVFNEKESVDFTCICGDITEYGVATTTELAMYKNMVDTKSPNTPVYTTSGNHDCIGSNGSNKTEGLTHWMTNWSAYTNTDTTTNQLTFNTNGTCFEFSRQAGEHTDHFLFFGMNYYNFGAVNKNPYLTEDVEWLENKLRSYANDRCFVITHMFFCDRAGNFKERYPSGNWLLDPQLSKLESLCDTYKNSVWFSGHSHWKWHLQETYRDETIYGTTQQPLSEFNNVWHEQSSGEGGWCVHVAGCANPIDSLKTHSESTGWSRESTSNYAYQASEGAIIDVYEDYIDIRGVSFKAYNSPTDYDTNYNTKYLPIATYRCMVGHDHVETPVIIKMYPRMGKENTNNNGTGISHLSGWNEGADDYVSVTISATSSGYLIATGNVLETSMPESYTITYDNLVCEKIYTDGVTPSVVIDNNAVVNLGFYNGSYTLNPITTTLQSTSGTGYACYKYIDMESDNYSSQAQESFYGVQFQSASKFNQANNSSWWDQGETIGKDFYVKITIKNLKINGDSVVC